MGFKVWGNSDNNYSESNMKVVCTVRTICNHPSACFPGCSYLSVLYITTHAVNEWHVAQVVVEWLLLQIKHFCDQYCYLWSLRWISRNQMIPVDLIALQWSGTKYVLYLKYRWQHRVLKKNTGFFFLYFFITIKKLNGNININICNSPFYRNIKTLAVSIIR